MTKANKNHRSKVKLSHDLSFHLFAEPVCPALTSQPQFSTSITAKTGRAYKDCLSDDIPKPLSCKMFCQDGFEVAGVESVSCGDSTTQGSYVGSWSDDLGTCLSELNY